MLWGWICSGIGMFLSRSPSHDRTSNRFHILLCLPCVILRSDRLGNTVSFQHKSIITNPTLSHANKLMNAISHCSRVFEGKSNVDNDTALIELEHLMKATQAAIDNDELQPVFRTACH